MCVICPWTFKKAARHAQNHTTETYSQYRVDANATGFKNGKGKPYTINRGVARVISRCCQHHVARGDHVGAMMIARAFTDKNHKRPYE